MSFKFNGRWPDQPSSAFLFINQTKDNLFWTFVSAVLIWTFFEALMFWAGSNGYAPMRTEMGWVSFAVVLLLVRSAATSISK